jgi:hypothetical protein
MGFSSARQLGGARSASTARPASSHQTLSMAAIEHEIDRWAVSSWALAVLFDK